jgi:transposase
VVDALRALRGVNTIIAATVVAEIGDITRFENPRQLANDRETLGVRWETYPFLERGNPVSDQVRR